MRSFFNSSNNDKSASDFLNKKKAKNTYQVITNNITNNKYNLSNTSKINSYDELLDFKKGIYYTSENGSRIEIPIYPNGLNSQSTTRLIKINDCSGTTIKTVQNPPLKNQISQTWNLYEGSFLLGYKLDYKTIRNCNNILEPVLAKRSYIVDLNPKKSTGVGLARLNNKTPLRNFYFPSK